MPSFKEILIKFDSEARFTSIPGFRILSSIAPAALLLFILLFSLGSGLFSGSVIGSTHPDNDLGYFLALRNMAFYGDSHLPLWNPYVMCGVPLIAEIQSGMFYPPNVVFRLLPLATATNISLFIHLYLLALGTYFFGRKLNLSRPGAVIAAAVFSCCAPVFLRVFAGHHANLYTIAWIPAVFLIIHRIGNTAERKNFIYLGLVLCLQILAGHPQYLLYTVFFAWLYLLFAMRHLLRRDLIRSWLFKHAGFFFSIVLAVLIALPQMVPVYEMLSLSPRKALDVNDVAWFSLPFPNLLTLLTPRIFGDGVIFPYWGLYNLWEMCVYCGTMTLLLSAAAIFNIRRASHNIFFIFMAALALVMALGDGTPLLKLLYYILPGFKMFRGHSKVNLYCCFALAILAGTGYDALRASTFRKGRRFLFLLMGGVGLIFFLLLLLPYQSILTDPIQSFISDAQNDPRSYLPVPDFESAAFKEGAVNQAVMSVRYFLIFFFSGLILILLKLGLGSQRPLNAIIILFILGDLFLFTKTFVSSVDVRHWDLKREALDFLAKDKDPFRTAVITSFGPKYGITSNLEQIVGNYPYVLSRYSRMYNLANRGTPTASMKIGAIRRISPVYNLYNLKYLVFNSDQHFDIPGFYDAYNDGVLSILENHYARKRVYIPRAVKFVEDEKAALRGVVDLPTIRGDQTIIEKSWAGTLSFNYESLASRKDPAVTAEIVAYSPNRVELRVNLTSDSWIIMTDVFYPGWKAMIDGKTEAVMAPANYIFRAIFVPEGVQNIVLKYWPTNFTPSIVVALITLLGCCALVIYPRKDKVKME